MVIIIAIITILILLYVEYHSHDCVPGKTCSHKMKLPNTELDNEQYVDALIDMIENNYTYVSWRQSLLVAIIVGLPVIYFLINRFPTPKEWLIVTGIVFIGVQLSYNWLWTHFFYPNGVEIEKSLRSLRDRVRKMGKIGKQENYGNNYDFNQNYGLY